jgi:hypothetical protein
MNWSSYTSLVVAISIVGCVHPITYHNTKNYKSYVSSSVDEKSYVSATPTNKELISAFDEVQKEEETMIKGWITPRGAVAKGITLQDEESRERLNDALHSTPLGSDAKWQKAGVSFVLTPNSAIYNAYKSGGMCRDAFLMIYDNHSDETTRGLFCKRGMTSDWLLLK